MKKKEKEEEIHKLVSELTSSVRTEAFKESFAGIDILFFLIAAYTAFNVGSGGTKD